MTVDIREGNQIGLSRLFYTPPNDRGSLEIDKSHAHFGCEIALYLLNLRFEFPEELRGCHHDAIMKELIYDDFPLSPIEELSDLS